MDEVIELSDISDDTETFHHDLSDRGEWVAEGYSGGDSEASEDEEGEIAEDQLINDSQGEEDVPDGAKSSDDQESGVTGGPRFAGMWIPKPGETRRPARPSTTYTVEDDFGNASDSDERDEPRDYPWIAVRRGHGITHHKRTTSSRGPGKILEAVPRGTQRPIKNYPNPNSSLFVIIIEDSFTIVEKI